MVRRAHFDIIQAMPETTIKNPRTEDCARIALDEASAKLASDVVLLDLREATDFTDYFVIASGETDRHIESIAEDLRRKLRSMGVRLVGREGTGKGGWILLDFGGFIVHLFTRSVRNKYSLEKLWGRAPEIVRVQ